MLNKTNSFQKSGSDFGPFSIESNGHGHSHVQALAKVSHSFTDSSDGGRMIFIRAVREVQTSNVHARFNHLFKDGYFGRSRSFNEK